jgi:DNA invertase Pin-like site-specific DNA recombinase
MFIIKSPLCYAANKKTVNVAVYARASTLEKGQDPEHQLRELRAFVERKATEGWILALEFVDKVSGKRADKRPAFRKMLDAASRKEFDLVLFWSLDRFTREGPLGNATAPPGTYGSRRAVVELS